MGHSTVALAVGVGGPSAVAGHWLWRIEKRNHVIYKEYSLKEVIWLWMA